VVGLVSTYINGGGEVRIPGENLVEAVCALTGWNEADVRNEVDSLDDTEAVTPAEHLVQLIEYQGFDWNDFIVDTGGGVTFGHYEGNVTTNLRGFLQTLAPFIEPGGRLRYATEYGEDWHWYFDGNRMLDETAVEVTGTQLAAIRAAATEAAEAAEGGSNDEEIAALRDALDLALEALGLPELNELAGDES
jgi:guanyl-specific ribonuclease Sa